MNKKGGRTIIQEHRGLERYVFPCYSTDFECFKRQYRSLRDHVMSGNIRLGIPPYQPYSFQYENGTCIKLTGLENSELAGIHFDNANQEFMWTLELPFKIQQILNSTEHCVKDNSFSSVPADDQIDNEVLRDQEYTVKFANQYRKWPLKKFTGNATIKVTYPFQLRKKKLGIHMILNEESLDVLLDIPDLSQHNNGSLFERSLYELSEWAYSVVQNFDAAQHFGLPYTSRFRTVTEILPMRRFFLLYPDEDFSDLNFKYATPEHTGNFLSGVSLKSTLKNRERNPTVASQENYRARQRIPCVHGVLNF
ncbi:hypothetical protein NE865_09613 [Phthorimaea operculella]|nr:hypothetical protein NE865_09613 [Phthorimaea operculella]